MKQFKDELKYFLKGRMPKDRLGLLPSGFQRIGDIIILNLKPELKPLEKDIGGFVLKLFPGIKTVCVKFDGVKGELRMPQVRPVAGNGTLTTHIENGCRYRLDVAKVMFAKGNVRERGRLPKLVKPGETVVDMFAGIGYFSIPIAVHARPGKIYAIEKSPDAAGFLRENIRINRVSCIDVIGADNRDVSLPGVADRVIMGYMPMTEKFLQAAFGFLKARGIVHFHNIYRDYNLWEKPVKDLEVAGGKAGYVMEKITHKSVVKHFSPHTEHVVIDAVFRRA